MLPLQEASGRGVIRAGSDLALETADAGIVRDQVATEATGWRGHGLLEEYARGG
jgi:hypothetical protein